MERTKEFELALQEAELLKLMPQGGAIARQFLLLVEENKALRKELDNYQGYQLNDRHSDVAHYGRSPDEYIDFMDQMHYMDDER